jgi:hypothetical protein
VESLTPVVKFGGSSPFSLTGNYCGNNLDNVSQGYTGLSRSFTVSFSSGFSRRLVMQKSLKTMTRWSSMILVFMASVLAVQSAMAQVDEAVVRGKIEFDQTRLKSWDDNQLVVPFVEIEAKLRERVTPPRPPLPTGFDDWKLEAKQKWEKEFIESEAGKKFLENRKKLFEQAKVFDVKFEKDGTFVVYDVPVGVYGIQARVDKEIGDTKYGFEVFGQIEVLKDVDELMLQPLSVEVTPLLQRDQTAPPITVTTHDNKLDMNLETFRDDYLFLNFWTSTSPTAAREQKLVQEMYAALKPKHNVRLLSINIDSNRKQALDFIKKNKLKGSHGFTGGLAHRAIFDYGVRSFPSFWLIGKDDKILMSQFEVAQAMRVKPSITVIVSDRIEGKDAPTPADESRLEVDKEQVDERK